MRKSKFTESQIVAALKQVEGGRQVKFFAPRISSANDFFPAHGVSEMPAMKKQEGPLIGGPSYASRIAR